jgi:hypothetical protein
MAIKASAQETIIDITDAYSVYLTCASYTFPGGISSAKAGSCKTSVIAMRGADQVTAVVDSASVVKPAGVSVSVANGEDGTSELTISVTTAVTAPGKVTIPVTVDGQAEFTLEFSYGIALTGATGATGVGVKSIVEEYYLSTSNTTQTGGSWLTAPPAWANGKYMWTRSIITYTDNSTKQTAPICVTGSKGSTGATGSTGAAGVGIKSVDVQYYLSTSSASLTGGSWSTTPPAWANGKFMWSKTVTTYTNGKSEETEPVCITGAKGQTGDTGAQGPQGPQGPQGNAGAPGSDALVMVITSSNGTIFKNSKISTTLTAHVYKGGVELNSSQIAALGTVKWYKDGSATAAATGLTFNISSSTVNVKTNIVAQLEG